MMINGTSATGGTREVNYTGALTPDMMMLYCSTRLNSIDDQVQSHFDKQQKFREASSALNKVQSRFAELATKPDGLSNASDAEVAAMIGELVDAKNALPEGSQERVQLETAIRTFSNSTYRGITGGDGSFNKEECSSLATTLSTIAKDMNSSAELDMMQLQSLMSQRQTAVQMCTNLISSLGDTTKAITQKIGA